MSTDTHSNPGICKYYNSSTELGVCLWSGSDPSGNIIPQSGWLNGAKRSNCGKMVEVKANGKTIHAKLVDGCGLEATTPAKGCSIAWLTIAAFNALASPTETEGNGIASIEWKFLDGPV
ncbi:uncharacterized protein L969DRAFT_85629 [Mixia osmundae IAM 14324]|uniref:uncharacterized protein n=1 Tax=Mixia osmundae (strain CBS 9802 / IAM 14324 / JCM 22182 / KY 12970) TaxID=764103 RepID=UPI0004A5527F|nr:uncharacterized protein L969DRAFT_85629 [Mixia osmundae IAM 14324]KEI40465.1 hypothetical protein L969DRAFT_85629 [Mixia osmundae IAM 14324]